MMQSHAWLYMPCGMGDWVPHASGLMLSTADAAGLINVRSAPLPRSVLGCEAYLLRQPCPSSTSYASTYATSGSNCTDSYNCQLQSPSCCMLI